jgi:hypothetical protein
MAMQGDVKSAACAANAATTVTSARTRLKALTISYPSGGTVSIADGNSTTLFSFTAPAAVGTAHVIIPGEGILAEGGFIVTTAASTTAVAFYG